MKKIAGIYTITNKISGIIYVGQSVDYKKRWAEHKYKLRANIHVNAYLQSAWNKYGEENFEFALLEIVEGDNLKQLLYEREDYWIRHFNSKQRLYNAVPSASSTLGYKKTIEQIEKSASKLRGTKRSDSHRRIS